MCDALPSLLPKTTYKGKSSFQTYSDFLQWENFIQEQLASLPQTSALQRGFQTCEHWKQIFMEIIGKRGLALSITEDVLFLCKNRRIEM